jgi:hypothetical protein
MSFFTQLTEVVQVDGENSITLRCLTYGEESAIRQKHMGVSAGMDGTGSATVDPVAMERDTFRRAIVAWDGPGFEGRDVTPENIDALPSWVIDALKEPYNQLSTVAESEKKG